MKSPKVALVMGSHSDLLIMSEGAKILDYFHISYQMDIVSAHRTPKRMFEFAETVRKKGFRVIIAGAGGAAHLPGMIASLTTLPVIGVPIKSANSIDGWDSVLSILQMPNGVPVATVALNAAKNAGILAAQILGSVDSEIVKKLSMYKEKMYKKVCDSAEKLIRQNKNIKNI